MSQDEPTPQPPYSFGRDRHYDAGHHGQSRPPGYEADAYPHQGYRPGEHPGVGYPGHHYGPGVPPPPAGHRGLGVVVVLYVVAGFMVLWTGASAAVTVESATTRLSDDLMIGLFMTAGSIAITAGLAAWLIRIHRRRGDYRRILDEHYAQQFGHYPGR